MTHWLSRWLSGVRVRYRVRRILRQAQVCIEWERQHPGMWRFPAHVAKAILCREDL